MKIAFFSDIHANLPALQAVLEDIDSRKPDAVYCLGDLVGYAPWPNEVVEEIRRRNIPTIAGNYDEGIGLNSDECGCAYKTDDEKSWGKVSIAETNKWVNDETRAYLRMLPRHINLRLENNGEVLNLLMVHGSPRKINEYLFEDRPEKSMLRIMHDAHVDIMLFGHTHQPFHRIILDDEGNHLHAINLGSVGKPKDKDPRACYVMMELDTNLSKKDSSSVKVEFVRVDYDIEKAAKAIEATALPNVYAEMLRNGG